MTGAHMVYSVKKEDLIAAGAGVDSDRVVAHRLGMSRKGVLAARHRLGLQAMKPTNRWEAEPMLGKTPDAVLAKKHGVHNTTVRKARLRLGMPRYLRPWTCFDRFSVRFSPVERETLRLFAAGEPVPKTAARRAMRRHMRLKILSACARAVAAPMPTVDDWFRAAGMLDDSEETT